MGADGHVQCDKMLYGALYYAEITELGPLPNYEMEKIDFFDSLPDNWIYPTAHPLFNSAQKSVNSLDVYCEP